MSASPEEVRKCATCGQAAAVCIRDWRVTRFGFETGSSTRDFCCQACGHRFTLTQLPQIVAFGVLTVLLAITLCGGFVFACLTAHAVWPYVANPVVPGAAVPPIRFRATEPRRKCAACGGVTTCRQVTRHSVNLVPMGHSYDYACTSCRHGFRLRSAGRLAAIALGGSFLLVIGIPTATVGLGLIFLLGALFCFGVLVWSLVSLVRHPVLREP